MAVEYPVVWICYKLLISSSIDGRLIVSYFVSFLQGSLSCAACCLMSQNPQTLCLMSFVCVFVVWLESRFGLSSSAWAGSGRPLSGVCNVPPVFSHPCVGLGLPVRASGGATYLHTTSSHRHRLVLSSWWSALRTWSWDYMVVPPGGPAYTPPRSSPYPSWVQGIENLHFLSALRPWVRDWGLGLWAFIGILSSKLSLESNLFYGIFFSGKLPLTS